MATEDKRIDQLPAVTSLDLTSLMALQQSGNAKKVTLQQLLTYLNDNISPDNVVLFVSQSLTSTQQAQARSNIGAAASGEIPTGVVKYTTQTLTDAQKLQARTNIGAAAPGEGGGSAANAVLYVAQTLTEEQQHQARLNIRCGSVGEVSDDCVASGTYAHAEGFRTKASGYCSHVEGFDAKASGLYSHAEGLVSRALGSQSHAEGTSSDATGESSHAEGFETTATRKSQHVQGEFNIEDTEGTDGTVRGKYAHIVGNGASDTERSNAHTLDWAGVPWFAGDRVMLGGTGMDDENAVALMPIFVAQTLTDAQKLQARTNIGAIGADDLTTEVEEALAVAKESGEFDGPAGPQGPQGIQGEVGPQGETGPAGYTPVRGTDYWTAADIAEIKSYVDDAILGGEW